MRVGAIQDCRVGPQIALGDPVAQAANDEIGFIAFVVGRVKLDRLAVGTVRPKVFAHARTVVGNQRICSVQNRRGRAIVLLEFDDRSTRKVFLKLMNVLDARAAPAIDRLVIVADDEGYAFGAGKNSEPRILNCVGVLKLVNEQMLKAASVMREQLGVVAPQLVRAQ